ncbi:hypothetical protein D3C77_602670 [compost metagenome]
MKDPNQTDSWYTRSFQGRINVLHNFRAHAIRLSRYTPNNSGQFFDIPDDWLRVGSDSPSPVFRFDFHSRTANRLHFNIHRETEKLGISRNGYLGLYAFAEVSDFWKIEPLIDNGDTLTCYLRDHQGHVVKVTGTEDNRFLNVAEGEPVQIGITLA